MHFNVLPWLTGLQAIADALEQVPDDAWSYIIRNGAGEFEYPASQGTLAQAQRRRAHRDHAQESFAFSFRRLDDTVPNRTLPAFARARRMVDSRALFRLLHQLTGRRPLAIRQCYVSRFENGDFLYTHCDPGQSFGIVINLTGEWDPNHGGLTLLLEEDRRHPRACLLPERFQLLVFDTSARLVPHFVSMVTAPGHLRRLALVVRFDAAPADASVPT